MENKVDDLILDNVTDSDVDDLILNNITSGDLVFVTVTGNNFEFVADDISSSLWDSKNGVADFFSNESREDLISLFNQLPKPFTIVQEFHYVDRCFRDTYYTYFSNQHFDVNRYSRRICFFKGCLGESDFLSLDDEMCKKISKSFMGTCVLNPLPSGVIGRTLIDPEYLIVDNVRPVYIRLSEFTVHLYGKKLVVKAFPYRSQDGETMRCAEVTLLNLLEYFSNNFNDYKCVVPSEILDKEKMHNHERVLPSRGISYPILTKVLSDFGFSPRLYNLSSMDCFCLSKVSRAEELKRCLHYYIESGIPVALNLVPTGQGGPGHSIVCVGHGLVKDELKKRAQRNKWIPWDDKEKSHPIINSADFYDEYVIVDDNQPVYQVRDFEHLSLHPDMKVENIAVPLYKRMFLDAPDAAAIVRSILHHEHLGIDAWSGNFLEPNEDVIIRLFMTSSHSLKKYRFETIKHKSEREAYVLIPMPHFVWVCELYRTCDYDALNAFGEIVIDATSASVEHEVKSLIMMHYPGVIGFRYPDTASASFEQMIEFDEDDLFLGFKNNLTEIRRGDAV